MISSSNRNELNTKDRTISNIENSLYCSDSIDVSCANFKSFLTNEDTWSSIKWGEPQLNYDEIIDLVCEIALKLSRKHNLITGYGVVLTPYFIAKDIARMCLYEWLKCNFPNYSKSIFYNIIWGINCSTMPDEIINAVKSIVWLDPCVGCGVFPRVIIDIYKELNIPQPSIYGYDINPFFVILTNYILNKYNNYGSINQGDFLLNNQNQLTLFNILNNVQYDIVIGNPPYVQYNKIAKRDSYRKLYPEISGNKADLYTFFIANGLYSLKQKGVLGFVTPAQFQKSNYGSPIRKVINSEGCIKCIFDFNELPIFSKVSIHTSIFCIAKGLPQQDFIRYEYRELPLDTPIKYGYENGDVMFGANVSKSIWNLSSSNAHEIFEILNKGTIPLNRYSQGVYSGVKSGCKPAFFINKEDATRMGEYGNQFIKKMLLPKNIRTWNYTWNDEYLIVIPKNIVIDESSELYSHMTKYRNLLEKRADNITHNTWYGLRECNYYNKFNSPKIIYPDIATECRFSMDTQGFFIPDGAFFIPGEDYYLLGLLNSCIGRYYFREKCARIGNPKMGGRIRFKKVYVERFPVFPSNQGCSISERIAELSKSLSQTSFDLETQRQLDYLALELYKIPQKHYDELLEA